MFRMMFRFVVLVLAFSGASAIYYPADESKYEFDASTALTLEAYCGGCVACGPDAPCKRVCVRVIPHTGPPPTHTLQVK